MKFEKLEAPSQRELFIRKIQEMILSGELKIGTKIPPERELAQEMGISRTIVNTGIAVLETQGFLQVIPRQGVFVADYRRFASVDTLNAVMRIKGDIFTDKDIRSILEIRWALERLTISDAMKNMTEENLVQLYQVVEGIKNANTLQEAAEGAMEFQLELAAIGKNTMLGLIMSAFRGPCVTLWVRFCRLYGVQTLYEHTLHSLEYLEKKDYRGAILWIEEFTKEAIEGKFTLYNEDLKKNE
ncbi:MAG: GntR family transcriptional regulator [Lachnospiraceae bacterium]|nr:GntR family transcriptional regulator [Lachnospiraceae bacterium]